MLGHAARESFAESLSRFDDLDESFERRDASRQLRIVFDARIAAEIEDALAQPSFESLEKRVKEAQTADLHLLIAQFAQAQKDRKALLVESAKEKEQNETLCRRIEELN